jgi:hypothetical protein
LQLVGIVRFDQCLEAQFLGVRQERSSALIVDVAEENQHCVGTCDPRLQHVELLREEALCQERRRCCRTRCPQVVERAAEAFVDEDGHRRRAGVRKLRRESCGVRIGTEIARRR